jgi:hypothetical protein
MALVVATAGAAVAEDATPAGGGPMPIDLFSVDATVLDERVEGLIDITERPWEALVVRPDGRTVDAYFLAGDPDCTRLHELDATVQPSGLEVVVQTGNPAEAELCTQGLRPYVVTIELDDAMFSGGHQPSTE